MTRNRKTDRERVLHSATTLMLILLVMAIPLAAQEGAEDTLVLSTDSSRDPSITTTPTQGGAETQLDLSVMTQSLKWHGIYGDLLAVPTLSDGTDVFYNWTGESPQGEIFASRSGSVDWQSVTCAQAIDVQSEESITGTDSDSVSNTFNSSNVNSFDVGSSVFDTGDCGYAAFLIDDTGDHGTFEEILLHDGSDMVYTSILQPDTLGFNQENIDFQMIVPEDGTDDTATTYYLYAEIE